MSEADVFRRRDEAVFLLAWGGVFGPVHAEQAAGGDTVLFPRHDLLLTELELLGRPLVELF
jgi:hypothetical protein